MKTCEYCGCQNDDNTKFCTNCGAQFPDQEPVSAPASSWQQPTSGSAYTPAVIPDAQTYSALAITGFIISIVSIFCCGMTALIGLIFSLIGLFVSLKKTKKGTAFAVVGIIISGILTLFILLSIIVSWTAITTAYENSDDIDEFFDRLETELEERDARQNGRRSSSSGSDDDSSQFSSDWVDCEVSEDMTTIEIVYTDGIPDDFEFCGADFDEICDVLEDNLTLEDNFGQTVSFDREEFRRLLSIVLINSDEYDSMNLSRRQVLDMLSYLAALSCEMDNDGFEPDRAVYTEATDAYDFYGIIEPNNIGHAVVVFTDGTDSYYFDEAMCGDEICWSVVPGTYDVFRIGMTADSLNEYPAGGFAEFASWVSSILDPVI